MAKIYVTPKAGITSLPDPCAMGTASRDVCLPPEGKFVDDSVYWRRRAREGDVTITSGPAQKNALVSKPEKGGKAGE